MLLDGEPVTRLATRQVAQRLALLPQSPTAPEGLLVGDLVLRGRHPHQRWFRQWSRSDENVVAAAMAWTDTLQLKDRSLDELSGGQRQRAFIAKALATEPELLVLDEPTAGVDADSQARFRDALVDLARTQGGAVLLVSHELGAVADDLDRVVVLRHGEIVFDGAPGELVATGVSLGVHCQDLPMWLEEPG